MSVPSSAVELREFHQFLGARLSDDGVTWSPEEALDEWRRLHPEPDAATDDLAAVQEALNDMARGDRGMLFEEFDRDFRRRHQIPPPS